MQKLKQLSKDTVIYGVGGVLAKSFSFFLLPVYTNIFTPEQYGTIEFLAVIAAFIGALMASGMDSAQSYFFFEQKEHGITGQANVVSSILKWRLLWGSLCVLISTAFSPLISVYFFHSTLDWQYFAVAFSGTLFSQLVAQCAEVFRLIYKPVRYIGLTLSSNALSAISGLILIVYLDMGLFGYFLGMMLASVCVMFMGWWQIRPYLTFGSDVMVWWPKLLKFGMPLIPSAMAGYILNVSDRWFIDFYQGPAELGLYAVGAKFASALGLAVGTFRLAWWPHAMESMHQPDGTPIFCSVARLYVGCGVAGVILLTAFSPIIMNILISKQYFRAFPLIGILGWQSLFYGFYLIGAAGIWKTKKTYLAPLLLTGAALLNIALDYWLVPVWGGVGAALATSISFAVWNVAALLVSEYLWPVGYPFIILITQIVIGVLTCFFILACYQQSITYMYPFGAASCAILLLTFITIPFDIVKKYVVGVRYRG